MQKLPSLRNTIRLLPNVPIGGVQKLSLVDYPGYVAAALFLTGCNMRCGYCHNPELVLPERLAPSIPIDEVLLFLHSRIGKLDGVVISGGEPTIHDELPSLVRHIKAMGYRIKLDTNGTNPDMVADMLRKGLLDFIAMDIKGPLEKYIAIAARPINIDAITRTIRLLIDSGVSHEFRTTVVKSQLDVSDFEKIGTMVAGAERFALQHFRTGTVLSPQFQQANTFTDEEFTAAKAIMERYVDTCVIH